MGPSRAETIYSPESQLRSPLALLRSMARDLRASRPLAWRLVVRDVRARYRQTLLGILWAFFPPLATAFTFVVLNRANVIQVETPIPYPAYVLIGTFIWQLLVDSLTAPLRVVNASRSMLARANFPREALILSALGQVFFDTLIRLAILVAVFLWYGIAPSPSLALVAPVLLIIALFGTTLGLLITPVGILYGDVAVFLPTATGLWLLLTPVIYPLPPGSALAWLNPATPLVVTARELLMGNDLTHLAAFATVSALATGGLFAMWIVYRVSLPIVIERVSGG